MLATVAAVSTALLMVACKKEVPAVDLHAQMREAAEQYYGYLLNENYDQFANGISTSNLSLEGISNDSIPISYRQQLADAAAQYAQKEMKRRGGLIAVHALGDSLYVDSLSGHVDLELTFGDQTQEEIALPMVQEKDVWKMK